VPARVRFLSCEPLLGPVDVLQWMPELDWVIAGGESGPGARPSHPDWFCSLRDQCARHGAAFFFKQWGEWGWLPGRGDIALHASGQQVGREVRARDLPADIRDDAKWRSMKRLGKRAAGAMLDGREHREVPHG
jgi:protein gp37